VEKLPSRHPVSRAVHLRSSLLIRTTQHDLPCLVQGPLSPLPQDGCSCRITATFQKKSQVNKGFVVIRLQIHSAAKAVFGLLQVPCRLTNQPQQDIGRCTGTVRPHACLTQRGSSL
jgi:hypothetical protein